MHADSQLLLVEEKQIAGLRKSCSFKMITGVDVVQFASTGKWYQVQITHVVSTTEKMLHKRKPVNGYFQFKILKYAASETYLYFL
ncbi:hypothetical protein [Microbulbifer sp. JMSA003]|uniref:hypothetical protein n=1 Tax=Microbulbifer sp. JMSA003 TaxID=3243369 RepID=UPI004039C8E7